MKPTAIHMNDLGVSFQGFSFSYRGENPYWKGEEKILQPQLEKLGYAVQRWWTTDGDSFGPMTRAARCTKDGKLFDIWYG